jgi:hypothetical protein
MSNHSGVGVLNMKSTLLIATMLLAAPLATSPAFAAGCLKGAAVGGLAGHNAGHGVAGAAVGCAVGHHEANKAARDNVQKPDQTNSNDHS